MALTMALTSALASDLAGADTLQAQAANSSVAAWLRAG
jgi:hypothetical protein